VGVPGARGEIIGRSEKLLIYRPAEGDRLPAMAARLLGDESKAWWISEANDNATMPTAGAPMVVPLVATNPLGVGPDRYQTVPVLCYHRFGAGGSKMVMSPSSFAAQLDWLARNRWHVIRLSELGEFLAGRRALPQRSVVITIDDGYESVHRHAFPLLRKYGFAATLFVYTDFIGAGDALSWAQLQELQGSGLVDVQAHSKTHRNLIARNAGETDARYRANIEAEMKVPKETLDRRVPGAQVRQIAYPFGDANELAIDSALRSGYELGLTVLPGGNAFFAQPMLLRRTMIFGDIDLESFKAKLQVQRPIPAP